MLTAVKQGSNIISNHVCLPCRDYHVTRVDFANKQTRTLQGTLLEANINLKGSFGKAFKLMALDGPSSKYEHCKVHYREPTSISEAVTEWHITDGIRPLTYNIVQITMENTKICQLLPNLASSLCGRSQHHGDAVPPHWSMLAQ